MPGEHETFGLVALEAAACGARGRRCTTAPAARRAGALAHTFRPGDVDEPAAAIERARARRAWTGRRRALRRRATLGARVRRRARGPRGAAQAMRRMTPLATAGCAIAVAIHDVEPATFERCVLIREWLDDHGVDARDAAGDPRADLHPFSDRSPELANWLLDASRRATRSPSTASSTGARGGPARSRARSRGGRAATPRSSSGWTPRRRAQRSTPGAACSPARNRAERLRRPRLRVHAARCASTCDAASTGGRRCSRLRGAQRTPHAGAHARHEHALKRLPRPRSSAPGAALAGQLLRLDLHPADLDHTRHILAVEWVLQRARERAAVTYDDLC